MIDYPTSIDTFIDPSTSDNLDTPGVVHNEQHADANNAVEALETKLGTGSSTPTLGSVLHGTGSGSSAWAKASLTADVTGTLPVANGGTGVTSSTGTGAVVLSTSPTLVTPILGVATTTSLNGLTVSTTTGTLSLANSSTLITSGGNSITLTSTGTTSVTLPTSGTLATKAGTETLSNKRITRRVATVTDSATPTINTDNTDVAYLVGLSQAVTSFTTNLSGTPVNGDSFILSITDDGTARALTFGAKFEASGNVPLPTITVLGIRLDIEFFWNIVTLKWRCTRVS